MMVYNTIEMSKFRDKLNEAISKSTTEKHIPISYVTPSEILKSLMSSNIDFRITDIDFWSDWENGKIDISEQDFLRKVVDESLIQSQKVIVLYDDCFKDNIVYETYFEEIPELKDKVINSDSLLEPFDHVFYFESDNKIIAVHHEGKRIEARLSPAGSSAVSSL